MAKIFKNNSKLFFGVILLFAVFLTIFPVFFASAVTREYCEYKGGTYELGECKCLKPHQEWSDGCVCKFGYIPQNGECVTSTSSRPILDDTQTVPTSPEKTTPVVVSQQSGGNTNGSYSSGNEVISNPLTYNTFEELIDHVINFVTMLALILVPLIIVYAAFLYMTSEGDPGKVKLAQSMIFYAIIGLFVVLLSKAIISIIHGVLS
jgi:hypothetical protein